MTDTTLTCEAVGKEKKGKQTGREETWRREGEGQQDASQMSGVPAIRPFLADLPQVKDAAVRSSLTYAQAALSLP